MTHLMRHNRRLLAGCCCLMIIPGCFSVYASSQEEHAAPLRLETPTWDSEKKVLNLVMEAGKQQTVNIKNAFDESQILLRMRLKENAIKVGIRISNTVPCRLVLHNETTGATTHRDVTDIRTGNRPVDCAPNISSEKTLQVACRLN